MPSLASRRGLIASMAAGAVLGGTGCVGILDDSASGASGSTPWPMVGRDPENTAHNGRMRLGPVRKQWTFEPDVFGTLNRRGPVINSDGIYLTAIEEIQDGSDIGSITAVGLDGSHEWTTETSYRPGPPTLFDGDLVIPGDIRIHSYDATSAHSGWFYNVSMADSLVSLDERGEILVQDGNSIQTLRPGSDDMGPRYQSSNVESVRLSRPATDGEHLVAPTIFDSDQSYVVAFETGNGEELWVAPRDGTDSASAVIVEDRVVVPEETHTGPSVFALSLGDGRELWRTTIEVREDRWYSIGQVSAISNTIALPYNDTSDSSNRHHGIAGIDASTGEVLWEIETTGDGFTGVTSDRNQFFATSGCRVYGINSDGTVQWERTVDPCNGLGIPIPAQSRLFVPDSERLHTFT